MINMIEASGYVCIVDKFGFVSNSHSDGFYRIMTAAPWSEPITVGLKATFPCGFHRQFDQCLLGSIEHGWNTKRAFFRFSRFWYPNSADGSGLALFPVFRVETLCQEKSRLGFDGLHAIDSGCLLSLIVLCHPSYCQQSCCLRFDQSFWSL